MPRSWPLLLKLSSTLSSMQTILISFLTKSSLCQTQWDSGLDDGIERGGGRCVQNEEGQESGVDLSLLQWGSSPRPVTVSVSLASIPHSDQVLPAWDPPGWSRYLSGDLLNFFP